MACMGPESFVREGPTHLENAFIYIYFIYIYIDEVERNQLPHNR